MEKIKQYAATLYGLIILILGALLFRQNKRTESVESELASQKAQEGVRTNEAERQIARDNANGLVESYERLKRDE